MIPLIRKTIDDYIGSIDLENTPQHVMRFDLPLLIYDAICNSDDYCDLVNQKIIESIERSEHKETEAHHVETETELK